MKISPSDNAFILTTANNPLVTKANEYRLARDCADMSEAGQALMAEFKEIFDTFFDENKKAIGNNKLLIEQKKVANAFFEKALKAESKSIEQMAKYALPYPVLGLAEDKYFSDYAYELLLFYSTNPSFANAEKKQEIRKKARAMLSQPKPTKKEEVNYPNQKISTISFQ